MAMLTDEQATQIVEEVVRRQFGNVGVDLVKAYGALDHEGDPVIWVIVAAGADRNPLDAGGMSEMVRLVRQELLDNGDDRFPIFRFMTKADFDTLQDEAA